MKRIQMAPACFAEHLGSGRSVDRGGVFIMPSQIACFTSIAALSWIGPMYHDIRSISQCKDKPEHMRRCPL
jgi:hypothetical protein